MRGRKAGFLTFYQARNTELISFYRPPPIDVNSIDSLILHVTNALDQPTSIHHHGMFFNSTTWMDGADGITEWYISNSYGNLTYYILTCSS